MLYGTPRYSRYATSGTPLAVKKQFEALGARKLALYATIRRAKLELSDIELEEQRLERAYPKTLRLLS